MLMLLENGFNDYKILEYKEIVIGVGNSSSDGAEFRDIALKNMKEAAEAAGANAVINVRLEINNILGSTVEATAYGNAVVLELPNEKSTFDKHLKKNYDRFIASNLEKEGSKTAELVEMNGFNFVVCPNCNSKYKASINEQGQVHIKGFDDVDDEEPGLQIFCIRCGTKFTVPEKP